MSEIPEDVIKAATDFQDMVDADPKAYRAFDVAVLAILAERDRCAKIAESEKHNTNVQLSLPPQSAASYAIYQAIRRQ